MAFGHAALPTRKFVFGVRETPHGVPRSSHAVFDGRDLALDQMFKAYCFQQRLIGLEQVRRNRINAVVDAYGDMPNLLAAAEAEQTLLAAMRDQLAAANSHARETLSNLTLVIQINSQKVAVTAAWNAVTAERAVAFANAAVRASIDQIDADIQGAKDAARTAAVEAGLYWPTTLQVMQRVKRTGPAPRFQTWDGEESISIQFQRKPDKNSPKVPVLDSKGNPRIHPRSGKPMMSHSSGGSLSTTALFTPNSMCWIERLPPTVLYRPDTDPNRKHVVVHFRVASDARGKPVWAKLPVILARDFPDGEVKWVHLVRRRVGSRYKWEVMFDIARPEWTDHPAGADRATDGTVAVALGWRVIDGMVRAGEWVGDDGVSGTIRVPDDLVRQWRELEAIQSIRDKNFDIWKEVVINFVNSRTDLPLEWRQRTATLTHWNSPRRLAEFVLWWRDHRLPGDDDAYRAADGELISRRPAARDCYTGGRKQDRHLEDWQANLRARLISWRKELYHKIAIDLSYQYKNVVVAEIDWHEIAGNPEIEDADEKVNKTYRAVSACASLRDCLTNYMDEVTVDAHHITDDCAVCGNRVRHPGAGRWIRCERCGGERVDRAVNAANNMLSRALEAGVPV